MFKVTMVQLFTILSMGEVSTLEFLQKTTCLPQLEEFGIIIEN